MIRANGNGREGVFEIGFELSMLALKLFRSALSHFLPIWLAHRDNCAAATTRPRDIVNCPSELPSRLVFEHAFRSRQETSRSFEVCVSNSDKYGGSENCQTDKSNVLRSSRKFLDSSLATHLH